MWLLRVGTVTVVGSVGLPLAGAVVGLGLTLAVPVITVAVTVRAIAHSLERRRYRNQRQELELNYAVRQTVRMTSQAHSNYSPSTARRHCLF